MALENAFLTKFLRAAGFDAQPAAVEWSGEGNVLSYFGVTELAAAAVAAAALAAAELIAVTYGATPPRITVDRRLSSLWFGGSIRPEGWTLPPVWDSIAGDYEAADGWIRLHTNAPHHRAAALNVLGVTDERTAVARAVARWKKDELETQVVRMGGCAASMHSIQEWAAHPQGAAVSHEPLVISEAMAGASRAEKIGPRDRPLQGIRVLDLTRVLAGPVATRFLAGLGADVLRIDPPAWDEPAVAPEVTLGKRCVRLDLRDAEGANRFERLLADADVLIHGYRPGALDGLGFDVERRARIRPGLIDVSLDAYGWSGPWRSRRGFDSLVQMSSGIADAGMRWANSSRPVPLPVQALDHATGYLVAATALIGLAKRLRNDAGLHARTSLAAMARTLIDGPRASGGPEIAPPDSEDFSPAAEQTAWGPALRLKAPAEIAGTPLAWTIPAGPLGGGEPAWI